MATSSIPKGTADGYLAVLGKVSKSTGVFKMRRLLQLLSVLCLVFTVGAEAQQNWFPANVGSTSVHVSPTSSGNPTAMLLYVPTSVKFSSIYFYLFTPDSNTTDFYDLGIGECANLDCSQPNQTITIICNLGSSGSSGQGVNLTSTGAQSLPCAQGTQTISAGVYILLGVGNEADVAKCKGESVFPVIPFSATTPVTGTATNGSLTNPNETNFSTGNSGTNEQANICMISLH